MLTLRGIITILVLAGLFALAVVWISKQGGQLECGYLPKYQENLPKYM